MSDKLLSLTCKIKFSCIECPLNDYFALTGSAKDTVVPSPRRSLPSKDTDTSLCEKTRGGVLTAFLLAFLSFPDAC
ncbi:hypothetical protein PAXINDRAFT_103982 [Paxillus involutus ATCC 200175]|uniref:Uncharacterized protein n=1 Tax=Paxillus involutus ATCC 200175 TaxID=664439 RepID=A0A0C9T9F9_PAXIN|nr:hypothetical protein PAXINDRAFT_103982 [Paxillus involutus ATCC 200175]